jgi:HSP20 family protein
MFKRKKQKRSFLERLTGAVHLDDESAYNDNYSASPQNNKHIEQQPYEEGYSIDHNDPNTPEDIEEEVDGELSVDVLNTEDAIIIKAMVAGVRPGDIDIDISRDMVTIKAIRTDEHEVSEENFYQKELFWGSFSRNILLPEEIDVDSADAKEKNGLLILSLPKVDKNRKTKLQVKG